MKRASSRQISVLDGIGFILKRTVMKNFHKWSGLYLREENTQ